MRQPFCSSFPIVLLLIIILISPISSHGCGGGDGGGSGDFLDDTPSTSNVAPSGFVPHGMPGADPQFIEQQDFGLSPIETRNIELEQAEAQRDERRGSQDQAIEYIAVVGGGIGLGYATGGLSIGYQMLAAGIYAGTVGSGSDSSAADRGTNTIQDVVIATVPVPPPAQAIISIVVTEGRNAMPESGSSDQSPAGYNHPVSY